jgi:hypothetical protein
LPLWHGALFDPNWDYHCKMGYGFDLIEWYKRILQVPMIFDGTAYRFEAFTDEAINQKVESYSQCYKRMAPAEFKALRFLVP